MKVIIVSAVEICGRKGNIVHAVKEIISTFNDASVINFIDDYSVLMKMSQQTLEVCMQNLNHNWAGMEQRNYVFKTIDSINDIDDINISALAKKA